MNSQRFPLIDVLRGFAALLVVFYHVIAHRPWPSFPMEGLAKLPRMGWIGVDLFFVISGFVIAHAALSGYAQGGNWRQDFMLRRLRRIAPLYLATIVLFVLLVSPSFLQHGWATVMHVLTHLGFVHNLWAEYHGSLNAPNWSVGLEMQFYLLMVLVTPWIARNSPLKIYLLWASIALGWRYASTLVLPPGTASPIVQFIYSSQLPGTLDEFASGIVLAKLLRNGRLNFSWRKFGACALVAVLLLTLAWRKIPPETVYWQKPATIVFARTLLCAGFAALVACTILWPFRPGWISRPFRYLGEISYGIYLWHFPVLLTLLERTPYQGSRLLLATVGGSVTLAALSWHGFEKPWIQRASTRAKA
ncbi:MAG: hypothetical protein RLZZ401_2416 [Pseudomonadota bacterium]